MAQPPALNYTPVDLSPSPPLATASNLVLIDNYDSFTWNVYQYLVLEGANVTVFRNDEISLEQLISQNPTQLVVSPGPGHPDVDGDSGISKAAIAHFAGKIPVLGVCMGEQCMYSVFGGHVDVTGEIIHGKTSDLEHDGKGVYHGIPQHIPVTRYHSLAGTHTTLPSCLEVSSWTGKSDDGNQPGIIMGVRHKTFVVEGVQFHPESILTGDGRMMLKNFLKMQGGTWEEHERLSKEQPALSSNHVNGSAQTTNSHAQTNGSSSSKAANGVAPSKQGSILERIFNHRKAAVARQKEIPSQRPEDFQAAYELDLSPPLIPFPARLKQSPYTLSLMAEIKRASPSKGIISLSACAPAQARSYALAGASVISVLTEPEWFKGSLDDLRAVRQSLEGMRNRPAVLRKEFIFDRYQILEARLAGADTVLLIVKMLDEATLTDLYQYSQLLGMEPLVEVNTEEEMQVALQLGAKVIGVNNRNLTNFEVDLDTTSRLMAGVPEDTIVCALSGIFGPQDVEPYRKNGVGAVLVGEALMRAPDNVQFVRNLLGGGEALAPPRPDLLVKICGTRTPEAAKAAIGAGADLIGIILVDGRTRYVPDDTALAISRVVHSTPKGAVSSKQTTRTKNDHAADDFFEHAAGNFMHDNRRALLVGVFRNQPLSTILEKQKLLDLDIVQLHGDEPLEWAGLIPVPVIKSFSPTQPALATRGYHALPLLDSGAGGSGQSLEMEGIKKTLRADEGLRIVLAGGLNPDTVQTKIKDLGELAARVAGVDVSSGVEVDGQQDVEKIKAFISAAKGGQ